jgi:hypothetical protein
MLKFRGTLLLGLPLAAAGAQSSTRSAAPSQATVTEMRVITERNGGDPDTVLTRTTESGGRTRMDVTGPGAKKDPWQLMGTTEIMIATDGTPTAIFIDSARKTYWTTDLRAMMSAVPNATTMSIKPAATRDTSILDSLGDGGMVAGYPTLHFRRHATAQMTMNLLGQASTWTDAIVTDYYVAPGLTPDSDEQAARHKPEKPSRAGAGMLPRNMQGVAAAGAAAMRRMRKIGRIVETVTESTTTTDGGKMTNRRTEEFVSRRTIPASDSLFSIPEGYKRARPGFLPTT